MFIKTTDWDGLKDLKRASALYWSLVDDGKLTRSQADKLRFWTCREAALSRSDVPARLMQWLLAHPEAVLTQAEEDRASQVLKGPQVRKEGTGMTRIGDISGGSYP